MSRKKFFIRSLAVIASVAALAAVIVFLPGLLADSIYKNVDDINDGEMPPTVTSFQSGPEVVSTIGGSGEGLNCSLPPLVNIFFDGWYAELDKEARTATNELFYGGGAADAFCTRIQKKADALKADSSVTKFKR